MGQIKDNKECVLAIVGNKSDLDSEISNEQLTSLAEDEDGISAWTSAKTGEGIKELFEKILV